MNDQMHALEMARIKYASTVSLFGLVLSAALVVTLFFAGMKTSADIVAIVGIFTGMTGTLVGTFLGVQLGSSGREQERAERRKADAMANLAFGVMTEEQMHKVMEMANDKSSAP